MRDTRHEIQVEAFYDQDAAIYQTRRWLQNPVSRSNFQMTHDALFDALSPAPGDRVLEFGCGPGTWTREVAKVVASMTAVDISEQMLARARLYVDDARVTFIKSDFVEFQSQNAYDKVFGVRVFEHFPEKLHVLKNIHSMLRPGGRLVIITKTVPSIWNGRVSFLRTVRRLLRKSSPLRGSSEGFWMERVAPWRLRALMTTAGFGQIRMSPVIVRVPVMARGEDEYPLIYPPLESPILSLSGKIAGVIRRAPTPLLWASLLFSESYLATGVKPEVI